MPFTVPGLGEIRLRPATAADRELIEGLYLESMTVLLTALGSFDAHAVKRRLLAIHRREDARMVLADGAVVGWLEVGVGPDRLTLHQVHLVEAVRGRGLGTRLVTWLQAAATRLNRPLMLYVVSNNPARRLYERLGFSVVGDSGVKIRMCYDPRPAPASLR